MPYIARYGISFRDIQLTSDLLGVGYAVAEAWLASQQGKAKGRPQYGVR